MGIKQVYRYECDRCGAIENSDCKSLPYGWECVTLCTAAGLGSVVTEFYLCNYCSNVYLEKLGSFIDEG